MKYTIKDKEGSGIHINPANKGKFTATKKKTGKSTEALTHSKNPLTKKRAVFAQNAKKWKHEDGGEIELQDEDTLLASRPKRRKIKRIKVNKTFRGSGKSRCESGNCKEEVSTEVNLAKKGTKLTKDYIKEAKKKPGGSNVGKKTFASGKPRKGPYVGPSGGAPKGSFPIPDKKHAKSALALAHNAPNPAGIKAAVHRKYPTLKTGGTISNVFDISKILDIWKK